MFVSWDTDVGWNGTSLIPRNRHANNQLGLTPAEPTCYLDRLSSSNLTWIDACRANS
jgi:hypothetical protein